MPVISGIKVDAVQIGQSATDSQNFQWSSNNDGTAKLARGSDGTLGDILTVAASGNLGNGGLPMFACRAWGRFTGATGALLGGGNCTVTRNSTGNYAVAFLTNMPDANYSVVVNGFDASGDAGSTGVVVAVGYTTSGFTIDCETGNASPSQADPTNVSFAVFR